MWVCKRARSRARVCVDYFRLYRGARNLRSGSRVDRFRASFRRPRATDRSVLRTEDPRFLDPPRTSFNFRASDDFPVRSKHRGIRRASIQGSTTPGFS